MVGAHTTFQEDEVSIMKQKRQAEELARGRSRTRTKALAKPRASSSRGPQPKAKPKAQPKKRSGNLPGQKRHRTAKKLPKPQGKGSTRVTLQPQRTMRR